MSHPAGHVKASLPEGLFTELKPSGAFAEELKVAGWDPTNPKLSYPDHVFDACLKVAARHCHPRLGETAAMTELGRAFTRGFRRTAVGKVALAVLPALSPALLVDYLPKVVRLTASTMTFEVVGKGERERVVEVGTPDITPLPDFMAGAVAEASQHIKVEVAGRRPRGYTLKLSW